MILGFSTKTRSTIKTRDRVCVSCGGPASNAHHRRRRRENGDGKAHTPANGVLLCGSGNVDGCHGRAHKDRAWAEEKGYVVPSLEDPSERPVWHYSRGWIYLDESGSWTAAG